MKKDNLWKKKAVAFITSQAVSLFGSSIVQMAIVWYVTMQTSSGIWLTILTLSSFLPQMIISPFAGVWADRYNKKKTIILADVLIAVSTLIFAIFLQINNLANTSLIAIVVVSINYLIIPAGTILLFIGIGIPLFKSFYKEGIL